MANAVEHEFFSLVPIEVRFLADDFPGPLKPASGRVAHNSISSSFIMFGVKTLVGNAHILRPLPNVFYVSSK